VTFPSFIKDENFISLLERMLYKNPSSRLQKLSEVKHHDWLVDFPWEELADLNIETPYIPNVNKEELRTVKTFEEYVKVRYKLNRK
jgi:serine/threonine protein kinase